jgi:hypothetical protein
MPGPPWSPLPRTAKPTTARFSAAVKLLNRGYGRPAQSLDLHLSADAIAKRLSDMTDAELAALEARMIAALGNASSLTFVEEIYYDIS